VKFIQLSVDEIGEYPVSNEQAEWINSKINLRSSQYSKSKTKTQINNNKKSKRIEKISQIGFAIVGAERHDCTKVERHYTHVKALYGKTVREMGASYPG